MAPLFQKIITFSLLPVFTMIVGGVIASIRKPSGDIRSLILHFVAGVVFSIVAVEILSDIVKTLEKKTAGVETDKIAFSLLTAIAGDIFIDGLLLGTGFIAGNTEGIPLVIALSLELLSLDMTTAT